MVMRLVEQLEAEERRDLLNERCLRVEVAGELGDVLRHTEKLLAERRAALALEVRWAALDERDERRLEAVVALADKDVDDVVAPASRGVSAFTRQGATRREG